MFIAMMYQKKLIPYIVICAFTLCAAHLRAQELKSIAQDTTVLPFCITANASVDLNIHSSSFTQLPGVANCCTEFVGGKGLGFAIGA